MSRSFYILWSGQLVSLLGSSLTGFAVAIWLFEKTNSPFWMSLAVFVKLLPNIYFSLFAGHLVDRWPLKRLIMTGNALLMILTIALGFYASTREVVPVMVLLLLFCTGLVESVLQLAFQLSTVQLTKPELFMRSQGLVTLIENAPLVLAPFAGALAYNQLGLGGVLFLDSLSYAFAILSLLFVSLPAMTSRAPSASPKWFSGIRSILDHPKLRQLQTHFLFSNFFNGLLAGLVAAFVLKETQGDKISLAWVNSSATIGMALGALVLLSLPIQRRLGLIIAIGTIAGALSGRVLFGISTSVIAWCIGIGIRQFMIPFINSANQTLWVQSTSASDRGAIFGARRLLSQGLYPIAVPLGGWLSSFPETVTLPQLFLFIGVAEALVGVCAIRRLVDLSSDR